MSHIAVHFAGRDRALLFGCLGLAVALIAVLAVFTPPEEDATPSTYNTDTHGAKAAYLLLAQSGYRVERWTRPMEELGATVDAQTTLVLPSPDGAKPTAEAVRAVLDHGGRVIAAGLAGAEVLPGGAAMPAGHGPEHDCKAEANGFSFLNAAADVRLRTTARWTASGPRFHVDYTCEGLPVVVSYAAGASGRGQAIWWADSLPLENGGITRGDNLAFVLASLGPSEGARIVWDEAPPAEPSSLWSYAAGTPVHLVGWQLALCAVLLLASISRRNGPLRPDPVLSRAAPMEFVVAMGALYAKAHATNTAVTLAYRGFIDRVDRYVPVRALEEREELDEQGGAAAIADLLASRGPVSASLRADLTAAAATRYADPVPVRRALALVRALHAHEHALLAALKPSYTPDTAARKEERAS